MGSPLNIHQGEPDPPLKQTINWPKNFDDGQKEINGNKYVGVRDIDGVRNIDDEKYIFKSGNWAVKITSEGKFKTDCNVKNSK